MSYKARGLKYIIKHEISNVLQSTMSHMSYKARCLICIVKNDVSNVL